MWSRFLESDKFVVKGVKLGFMSFRIYTSDRHYRIQPFYDYINWSSNLKIFCSGRDSRKKQALYISEHQDLLNIYDVIDSESKENVGIIKYHFGSWEIVDENNNYFVVAKDSLLREIFSLRYYPYYIVDSAGKIFAKLQKDSPAFLPSVFSYTIDFSLDKRKLLDKRLALAVLILFILSSERLGTLEKLKLYVHLKLQRMAQNRFWR